VDEADAPLLLTLAEYRTRLADAPGHLQMITDGLFINPVISAVSIVEKFTVSRQAAMKWIRRLRFAKVLTDSKRSVRETCHIASQLLENRSHQWGRDEQRDMRDADRPLDVVQENALRPGRNQDLLMSPVPTPGRSPLARQSIV
jgi:hypothetical protein